MQNNNDSKKIYALYERLSVDDRSNQESDSIVFQKQYLEGYCFKNGYLPFQHYTDDGISGADFSRPGWNRMIADIEAGKIAMVIVKDMSRIGRDYLQVGLFTEAFLPRCGVGFIAVMDNIDSRNRESTEFAPILNLMSEWYLKDISAKIKAAYRAKGNSGKPTGNLPPYGYVKDPMDKDHWLIDPEPAALVRRIFQMTIDGFGYTQIAATLTKEKIPSPSMYLYQSGQRKKAPKNPYTWNTTTINAILDRLEYVGCTVNFKTYRVSYKDHHKHKTPKDEHKIFPDTHEPIISMETWELAQKKRIKGKPVIPYNKNHVLKGKVLCADCGAKMYHKFYQWKRQYDELGNEIKGKKSEVDSYYCSTYIISHQKFREDCSRHYIRIDALTELVLTTLRAAADAVLSDEEHFMELVQAIPKQESGEEWKTAQKSLVQKQNRCAELDRLIQRLYEENIAGRISDKRFEVLSRQYETEQEQIEQEILVLEEIANSYADSQKDIRKFADLVKKHGEFTELTQEVADLFIEKILVHEADLSTGEREQEVEIYLNFIGKIQFPEPELTAEEKAAQETERQKKIEAYEERKRKRAKYMERAREKRRQKRERQKALQKENNQE